MLRPASLRQLRWISSPPWKSYGSLLPENIGFRRNCRKLGFLLKFKPLGWCWWCPMKRQSRFYRPNFLFLGAKTFIWYFWYFVFMLSDWLIMFIILRSNCLLLNNDGHTENFCERWQLGGSREDHTDWGAWQHCADPRIRPWTCCWRVHWCHCFEQ